MIYGIGVDSVQIDRVAKSITQDTFLKRVYSEGERAMFEGRSEKRQAEMAAGCFAAKEAFLKATGNGLGRFALSDIGALRQFATPDASTGRPYYELSGPAAEYLKENGLVAHLSLTHDGGMATAVAMLEKT